MGAVSATAAAKPRRFAWGRAAFAQAGRNGGILGIVDQGLLAAGSFIANVAIARFASLAEFGAYMLLVSAFAFLSDLQTSLITSPYMILAPSVPAERRAAYRASVVVQGLGAAALAALAALLVALFGIHAGHSGLTLAAAALSPACLGAMLLRDQVRRVRIADLDVLGAARVDAAATALVAAGMAALVLGGRFTLSAALAVIAAAYAIPCARWIRRELDAGAFAAAPGDLVSNWRHGRWLFLSALVWAAVNYIYPWAIAYYGGVGAVGGWGAAFSALALCNIPILGLQNYAGASVLRDGARDGVRGLRRLILAWIGRFTAVSLLFFGIYALFGGQIVVLLYGAKYTGLGRLAGLLAFNVVLTSANFCVSRGLFAMERSDLDAATNALPVVFLLLAGFWLIAHFGAVGAAASLCASNGLSLAMRGVVFITVTRGRTTDAS